MLSYSDIMQNIFYYYPIYCRAKLAANKRQGFSWVPGELEVGFALDQIQGSIDDLAATLMLYTATLILCAGREPEIANKAILNHIHCLIEQHGIEVLLNKLSEADAKTVSSDLQLLGVQ